MPIASPARQPRDVVIGFSRAVGLAGFLTLAALAWDGVEERSWAIITGYVSANAVLALLVSTQRRPNLRAGIALPGTGLSIAIFIVGALTIGLLLLPAVVCWILCASRVLRPAAVRTSVPVILVLAIVGAGF